MKKYFLLLLLFPLLLAGKEKTFFKVVLPANASNVEKAAGAELASYLKKLYTKPITFQGKKVPLLTFYVGKNSLKGAKLPKSYPEFFLKAGKDFILLAGHDDPGISPWSQNGETGTLLAVYYFLRKHGGLTVFGPGAKGEKLALDTPIKMAPLAIPCPSYEARHIILATRSKEIPYKERIRFYKKMLCRMPRYAMPDFYYTTLGKWGKRFKDRPELFAIHEGKRVNKIYPRHLPCFSNPEVFKIMEKDIMKELSWRKGARSIRLFSDAPVKICECKECSREKDISNYFYTNVNKIAKLIHKKRPDLYFHTQEKMGYYYNPPKGVKLEKNMVIEIASGFPFGKSYTRNLPLFQAWKEAGAKVMIRFYARVPFWKDYPICNPRALVKHYNFMQPYAVGTRWGEGRNVTYYQCALLLYLQAEVMFDHTINGEKAMHKFFSLAYPGAEKELMEYYTLMEKYRFAHPSWMNPLHGSLQYKYLLAGEKILQKAMKKVKDPYYLRPLYEDLVRVRKLAERSRDMMDAHNRFLVKFKKEMKGKYPLAIPYDPAGKKSVSWLLQPSVPVVPPFQEGTVKVSYDRKNIHFLLEADEADVKEMMKGKSFQKANLLEIMIAPPAGIDFPYIQLYTDAAGEILFLKYTNSGVKTQLPSKEIKVEFKPFPGKKKWYLSVNFPRSFLKETLRGKKGRIGIFRSRYSNGGKVIQRSALNCGNFHDHSTYLPFTLQ